MPAKKKEIFKQLPPKFQQGVEYNAKSSYTWSVYTNASQMDNWLAVGPSKWTLTNAPGIGGLHGRNNGFPSSKWPVNLLHIGFVPRSGRLLPTLTTIVAGWFLPVMNINTICFFLFHGRNILWRTNKKHLRVCNVILFTQQEWEGKKIPANYWKSGKDIFYHCRATILK